MAAPPTAPAAPGFFSEREHEMVRVLVDLIIPRDARSRSATDAGVPEFIDFMMIDQPERQLPTRGGLAWVDHRARRRFGDGFLEIPESQRCQLLDEIAYPDSAQPEVSAGVAFFNAFRDLTATGFWTSRIGMDDLDYQGNKFVPEWKGCPDEVLRHLGIADVPWPEPHQVEGEAAKSASIHDGH